jgi:hypothetical protein
MVVVKVTVVTLQVVAPLVLLRLTVEAVEQVLTVHGLVAVAVVQAVPAAQVFLIPEVVQVAQVHNG